MQWNKRNYRQLCRFIAGQFCMIIIRILKMLKLILADIAWFKVLQTGVITVEKMVLKVIS